MHLSNNNSSNFINPINNIPTVSSSYGNISTVQSSPKALPRNQHTEASTQVFQRNKLDSDKPASNLLPTSYLRRLYKLSSNKNNDETGVSNCNNTQDFKDIHTSNKNEINLQNSRTKMFDGVYLSVNRRTQPGISAAIRSLSQNMKPNMSPSNGFINDFNGDDVTNNTGTTNINIKENSHDKVVTNDKNDKSEAFSYLTSYNYPFLSNNRLSPHLSGVEYSSSKNKRYSYTPTSFTNYNHGNNNSSNSSTQTQTMNNEDNNKFANHSPGETTKSDLIVSINSTKPNNSYNDLSMANNNCVCTVNHNNSKNNKYSSLCLPTSNYDTLFKRSSSASPYRPLANYHPSSSPLSTRKMLSNETLYNSNVNHHDGITPKSKYFDSKISDNNSNNVYRSSSNGTTAGTQTSATTLVPKNSLTTLSSVGRNEVSNGTRYGNKNNNLPPRSVKAKPSSCAKQLIDEASVEGNNKEPQEHHEYGRTYYIARRPQVIQSTYQKYLPHALNNDRTLSFTNIYYPKTDITDDNIEFRDKTTDKTMNRLPDVLKPNSYLSNSTLASHKRNSVSLTSLPNEIGSLPQYPTDDHHFENYFNNSLIANRNNFESYSPIHYRNNYTSYNSPRNVQNDQNRQSQQTNHSTKYTHYYHGNLEAFRSFSNSPEIGRKSSEGSIMLPCRSYNENMNMIASNSNLQPCLSASSPLKRKPYQVSFNLDRNMYIEYPYSESLTSLVQCKRVPGYISSSGVTPGETNANYRASPKYPFNWSNENGITTIGKVINGYDTEYSKQINYPPSLYTSRPTKPKNNRYSSPPPQPILNHDEDNNNVNYNTSEQTAIIDNFTPNSYIAPKPEIRFIDTSLSSPANYSSNGIYHSNTNKLPVFGKSLNSLKVLLPKSTHRFSANSNGAGNANLNGGKSLFKQTEQQDSVNTRHSSAIDILNQRSSFCS
ncbi:unnamed protein product [Schistosoma turkestanicum]|nr:unnamed protein product [Schistosoma turkestanicum]